MDPESGVTRGVFHLSYFSEASFTRMMKNAGYQRLELFPDNMGRCKGKADGFCTHNIRAVFRLPL